MRVTSFISNFTAFLGAVILVTGCNQSFQPIKDNANTTFSIYGYLDATADTQWVRLIPSRNQVDMFDEVPEMHVTLTHIESGNTTVMNDSLIFSRDGRHMLVVWTAMDIEPEQSYRLKAERPDGAESHITVTIPPDFPTPILYTGERGLSGELEFEGVERVADVQTLWKEKGRVPFRRFAKKTDQSKNSYTVSLLIGRDLRYFFGNDPPVINPLAIEPRQVFVASGGPEWNEDIPLLNDLEYATLENGSNIEGGIGYLIGIVSKTIPFKGCFNDKGENIACPLEKPFRYRW